MERDEAKPEGGGEPVADRAVPGVEGSGGVGEVGSVGVLRLRAARSAQDDGEKQTDAMANVNTEILSEAQNDDAEQTTAKANAGFLPLRQAQGQNDKLCGNDKLKETTATATATATANANANATAEAKATTVAKATAEAKATTGADPSAALRDDKQGDAIEGPTIRLEKKHPLAIRWMHWINFPVLFTMIWSGLLIYWNDSDNAYLHPHAVYRVGVGPVTLLRMFPAWFYTNRFWDMRYHVTEGLGYHFFFMWLFAINGLLYVTYLVASGNWRLMVPTMRSWKEAVQVTLFDLHLSKVHPPVRKYNGAQKIAYTAILLMGAGSLVTGLSIYKPTQVHWVTTLLGGYEMARWEHFWLTMGFCGFFLLHVFQVVKTGWNNFRGMVSGMEIRPADATPYVEERRDA